MAIECYFDDSYDNNGVPIVTMAGYVSTLEAWKEFEEAVLSYFNMHNISVFHAREFHNTDGNFKGWTTCKKVSFLEGLFDLLAPKVAFGISFSALSDVHTQRKTETGLSKSQSAYGWCFNAILDRLLRDEGILEGINKHGATISLKIEEGNKNNSGILQLYGNIIEQYCLEDRLGSLEFIHKKQCFAIQMADAIAFYSRRHAQLCEANARRSMPFDRYLKIMCDRIPHIGILATDFSGEHPA